MEPRFFSDVSKTVNITIRLDDHFGYTAGFGDHYEQELCSCNLKVFNLSRVVPELSGPRFKNFKFIDLSRLAVALHGLICRSANSSRLINCKKAN
ncbi:hypothetical protein TNCV_2864071 [Trichonephila clavipes]|nr:hypothetical protein TNCV_2864071 [Trichonephila clavipes]